MVGLVEMNTTEHLELILTYCRRCLAIAEERTPGEWIHFTDQGQVGDVSTRDGDAIAMTQERSEIAQMGGNWRVEMIRVRNANAKFIATCAGVAEAGWQATIGIIEHLMKMHKSTPLEDYAPWSVNAILAAYPLELIQAK